MTIKKIIIIGLIVLMLESIAGYIYLTYGRKEIALPEKTTPLNPSPLPHSSSEVKKAVLSLKSSKELVKRGDLFKVNVGIESFTNQISAADLTLKYDPAFLTITASDSAKPFSNSLIFQKTVFNSLNSKQGLATISAVADLGKTFSGQGLLTSISFKAQKTGSTEIIIVFTPGETRDTNVVAETRDILESVENLSVNILP